MKNRILLALITIVFFSESSFIGIEKLTENQKPNVVFIAVDDLNDWVGFLKGHPQTITPNLDRLASQGMVFENAHCAASVCNPSRAAIMTGILPSTSGIYGNSQFLRDSPVLKDAVLLPKWFSNNGYYTLSRGKILHQPTGKWADPQSWDEIFQAKADNFGKPKSLNDSAMANGIKIVKNNDSNGEVGLDWGGLNIPTEKTPDYQNAVWAVEQLQRNFDKPFFMACGFFRPHLPFYVPQKYFDKFKLEDIILPSVKENDLDDLPKAGVNMSGGLKPNSDYNAIKNMQKEKEAVRAYLACIAYADDCIGVLLKGLEQSKYAKNTVVVLWGDHGWHLGEKKHYRKVTLWERATRMPLVIKAPFLVKAGSRCAKPVNLIDVYPTLTDLCGLPSNPSNQGHSMLPLLKNSQASWKYPSLTTMGKDNHALRNERYRYIKYSDGTEEFYDHKLDSNEWDNLASNPKYKAEKEKLKKWLPKVNADDVKSSKSKD
ncbi:MAG: sulfatase [Pseudarcicella sp.]|jgi:arylsulfatase A-like enzyme|nr:sulfatase [Pseudarcicella sp.]